MIAESAVPGERDIEAPAPKFAFVRRIKHNLEKRQLKNAWEQKGKRFVAAVSCIDLTLEEGDGGKFLQDLDNAMPDIVQEQGIYTFDILKATIKDGSFDTGHVLVMRNHKPGLAERVDRFLAPGDENPRDSAKGGVNANDDVSVFAWKLAGLGLVCAMGFVYVVRGASGCFS